MEVGKFYIIKDEYYEKFADCGLMGNKGSGHERPCYYCVEIKGLYYMIPISSQLSKYRELYRKKMKKYHGRYHGIRFGNLNGRPRAFLLQNLFPITQKYIDHVYTIDDGKNHKKEITVNPAFQKELQSTAEEILKIYRKGMKVLFTDLENLIGELEKEQQNK